MPVFSVIIPTYNRDQFLKTAINSVLTQSFQDFELIIIDDGSTDKTKALIQNITDPRISYIFQKNKGVSSARNRGILSAKGELLAFLDSDDKFDPEKLAITYHYIKKFPQINIFHSEEIWYKNNVLLAQKTKHKKPEGNVFEKALTLCCISMSTAVIKKSIFNELGLFDQNLPACEDYEFWLRAVSQYPVKLIPTALTIKSGGHPGQLSQKYQCMDKFRIYAIDKILNSNLLNERQKQLAIEELKIKCAIYINGARKRNKLKQAAAMEDILCKNCKIAKQR